MPRPPLILDAMISATSYPDATGEPQIVVKLQTDAFELNVHVRPVEVPRFELVASKPWSKGSIRIGECAGSPVFWCVDESGSKYVSVLVGRDDQLWDFAILLPPDSIDVVQRNIVACRLTGGGA
jgi:hypothetical protein